ncbi:DUF5694 domain-containing protein [Fictibacillus nanhaiensis]
MDEIKQVGFRLAKKMQQDKVYGVNWAVRGEVGSFFSYRSEST